MGIGTNPAKISPGGCRGSRRVWWWRESCDSGDLCCGQSPVLDSSSLGLLLIQIPSRGSQGTQDRTCHCPLASRALSSTGTARASQWDAETSLHPHPAPSEGPQVKATLLHLLQAFYTPGAVRSPWGHRCALCHPQHSPIRPCQRGSAAVPIPRARSCSHDSSSPRAGLMAVLCKAGGGCGKNTFKRSIRRWQPPNFPLSQQSLCLIRFLESI